MAERKTPMRTCVACRESKPKKQLIRIVKTGDEIKLDVTGKANGRGAYICDDAACLERMKKQKILNRVFACQVDDETYRKIEEDFFARKK